MNDSLAYIYKILQAIYIEKRQRPIFTKRTQQPLCFQSGPDKWGRYTLRVWPLSHHAMGRFRAFKSRVGMVARFENVLAE